MTFCLPASAPSPPGRSISPPLGREQSGLCSVVRTLLYYHIFQFPLTADELFRLSDHRWSDRPELERAIEAAVDQGVVVRVGDYHSLGEVGWGERRRRAQARAAAIQPAARRRARLIARFPWVRSVSISGTLSKGIFERDDDVDYFVVTAPGRLWLCRLGLMAFKKLFLFNSRKLFCINYFMAADRLVVPDHNLFTAMEIAWLDPVVDGGLYRDLVDANPWVATFLPNWTARLATSEAPPRRWVAQVCEWALAGALGSWIDERTRRLFSWRNRRRHRNLGPRLEQAMRAEPGVSKHHPRDFQGHILGRYTQLVEEAQARLGLPLLEEGPR